MTSTRPFRRPTALRRLLALGLLVFAAIAFSATRAQAAGETLSLVQNDPTAMVGHATNFTASGTLNPDDKMFGFDIFVFLKNADADPTCAADFDAESATAMHSGGNESWVSPASGFQVGTGPTFNQPSRSPSPGRATTCSAVTSRATSPRSRAASCAGPSRRTRPSPHRP